MSELSQCLGRKSLHVFFQLFERRYGQHLFCQHESNLERRLCYVSLFRNLPDLSICVLGSNSVKLSITSIQLTILASLIQPMSKMNMSVFTVIGSPVIYNKIDQKKIVTLSQLLIPTLYIIYGFGVGTYQKVPALKSNLTFILFKQQWTNLVKISTCLSVAHATPGVHGDNVLIGSCTPRCTQIWCFPFNPRTYVYIQNHTPTTVQRE